MQLNDIKAALNLAGIEPTEIVSVVAIVPFGDDAVQVIYRTPGGR
jgi:hypothetical protein